MGTINDLFAQAEADTKYKKGWFGETGVEWYTRRDGSGRRVIKVRYMVEMAKPGKYSSRRTATETFPYSPDGLRLAIEFAASH